MVGRREQPATRARRQRRNGISGCRRGRHGLPQGTAGQGIAWATIALHTTGTTGASSANSALTRPRLRSIYPYRRFVLIVSRSGTDVPPGPGKQFGTSVPTGKQRLARNRMDDSQQNNESVADQARATAEKIRGLREQTVAELARHQHSIEAVEEELRRRVAELAASYQSDAPSTEEFERQQATLAHYEEQIADFERRTSQLQASWDARLAERDATIAELQNLLAERDRQLEERSRQLEEVQEALTVERQRLAEREPVDAGQLESLAKERDALADKCRELEEQIATIEPHDANERSDLERRYELALEDLRQAKKERDELEAQVSQDAAARGGIIDGNDWQAQKARLLAQLEGESDDEANTPGRKAERLRIEAAIESTDKAVAAKERRIAELTTQLEELTSKVQDTPEPVDLEAQRREQEAEILDADEVIQKERTRLTELQEEWAGKVRAAELELSVERAKLARERASMEATIAAAARNEGESSSDGSQPRRRWLAALGLGESDETTEDE